MDLIAVNNFGDTRSGGLAGPMGLFIIVLMSIATVLLIRNMNKRLRRLPDSFDNVDKQPSEDSVADPTPGESPAGQHKDRSSSSDEDAEAQVSGSETSDQPAVPEDRTERS